MDGSSKTIYDLNLVELRTILSKRGLNKFGVRPALIERLRASLVEDGKSPETYNFNNCPELSREREHECKISDTDESKDVIEIKKEVSLVKEKTENGNNDVEMKEDVNGVKTSSQKNAIISEKNNEAVSEKIDNNSQESEDISLETGNSSLKKEIDDIKIEDVSMEYEDNGSMLLDLETTKGDIEGYEEMDDKVEESSDAAKAETNPKSTDENEKDEEKEEKTEANNIFGFKIQNLKKNITSAEVKRLVSTNGELNTVDIVATDDDSSEAVVTLKTEGDLEKCLKNLNNIEVDGRMITVSRVGNLPPTTTEEKCVFGDQNKSNRNLWISNLLISTKAQDLKQLLSKYGKVNGVKIVQNPKFPKHLCFGYVTMESNAEAEKCIKKLHKTIFNGKTIHIATTKKDINAAPAAANLTKKRPQVAKETKEQVVVKKKVDNLPPKRRKPMDRRPSVPPPVTKPTAEERYLLEKARREERELREIKRRNIEESKRLESMRSALKKERELLARDRLEFMRLQLEQEKIERDRLAREKNELRRRQIKMKLMEEARQSNKRSGSPSPRHDSKGPVRERRSREEYLEEEQRPSKEPKHHEEFVPKRHEEFVPKRHEEFVPKRHEEFVPKRHEEFVPKRHEDFVPKRHEEYPPKRHEEAYKRREEYSPKHREEYPPKHLEGPPSLMRSKPFSDRPQPLMRPDPPHHPEPPRFSKLYAERKEYRPSREELLRKPTLNSPPSKLDYRFEKEVRYPEPKREDMRFGSLWQPDMQNKALAASSSSKALWDSSWKSGGWNNQGSGQQHAGNNMGPVGNAGMSYIPPPGINSFVMDRYDNYKPMNTRKY